MMGKLKDLPPGFIRREPEVKGIALVFHLGMVGCQLAFDQDLRKIRQGGAAI